MISVSIPDNVTSIGDGAFEGDYNLTSINIPNSVTSIGRRAFYWCSQLTRVNIPYGITSIEDYTFSRSGLTNVNIPNSVTSIGNYSFCNCVSLTSINIPDSVTSIGDSAFSFGHSLSSVSMPNSVTSIGNNAFEYCNVLISVSIPDNVTSIGDGAFYYCNNLKWVLFKGNAVELFGDYVFKNTHRNFVIYYYKCAAGFTNLWHGYPTVGIDVTIDKFIDVLANHWAANSIGRLADKGIVNGYSDGTYRPNNKITREEAAAIIVKAVGLKTKGMVSDFLDVPENSWSSSSIAAAQEAGIINGYADGTFRPEAKVSREEVAAMVTKAFKLKLKSGATKFKDVPAKSWSKRSIDILTSNNIVNGYSDGTFRP